MVLQTSAPLFPLEAQNSIVSIAKQRGSSTNLLPS
jgi:hypothetical protein